jgi:hypothetical protein
LTRQGCRWRNNGDDLHHTCRNVGGSGGNGVDALTAERDKLEAENKRLRELVDGARVIVEVFQWSTPAQERWREEWLKKAAKAMKEASHE